MSEGMKTLILLRHAKSAWDDPHQKDIDRPLAPRGRKAAPKMADWMKSEHHIPDFVLCSTARRTRETLELSKAILPRGATVRYEQSLYLATPAELLAQIATVPESADRAMLVGHNPGLAELAAMLVAGGDSEAMSKLHAKFPTGAAAVIDFQARTWKEVQPGRGSLRAFLRPRDQD
jgi:phosphohistidine phosphatase